MSLISYSLFPLTAAIAMGESAACSSVYTLIRSLQPARSDVCLAHLSSSPTFRSLSDLPAVGNNMSAYLVVANRRMPQLARRRTACPDTVSSQGSTLAASKIRGKKYTQCNHFLLFKRNKKSVTAFEEVTAV